MITCEMLKSVISPFVVILTAAFAFFYKHWTDKIEEYQSHLFTLKQKAYDDLFLMKIVQDSDELTNLELFPPFTLNKFPVFDETVRIFIYWINRDYISIKYRSIHCSPLAVALLETFLEVIEIYLDLINHLNKSPIIYYLSEIILNHVIDSYSKRIQIYRPEQRPEKA